jgi:2-dehydro-3-deoxyphosphogluconate aldolase / (4S)-4-hydroxy-2-oxoglutarate aldolase
MTVFSRALDEVPIVGVVRAADPRTAERTARALAAGAIRVIEIALTTAASVDVVRALADDPPAGTVIGAGSVRTIADAWRALSAGARFLATPATSSDIVAVANARKTTVLCGGLTPTELDAADAAGADYVRVFPARAVGPGYLGAVLASMPGLALIPAGGITLEGVGDWFRQGARAVAVGGALAPSDPDEVDDAATTARAASFVSAASRIREGAAFALG